VAIANKLWMKVYNLAGTHLGKRGNSDGYHTLKADAWIQPAHGSRRSGSKMPVEAMAKQLGEPSCADLAVGRTVW